MTIKAAVIQMNAKQDVESNLAQALALVEQAHVKGARLIVLPENFAYMGPEVKRPEIAESLSAGGPILNACQTWARRLKCELVLGGFVETSSVPDKPHNSCIHLDAEGKVKAAYRKMHLFDAQVTDAIRYQESSYTEPGQDVVVTDTALGCLGLSICFDVRFPQLYQQLVQKGAVAVAVPAAFTATTGQAHWEVLLRARAIESQVYVLAAAQVGEHYGDRKTFGHAMIIDPWGKVLAECDGKNPGIAVAELDADEVETVRQKIPLK